LAAVLTQRTTFIFANQNQSDYVKTLRRTDDANLPAGPEIRAAQAQEEPSVYHRGHSDARRRHRRQLRHLQCGQLGPAAAAALPTTGSTRPRLQRISHDAATEVLALA